MGTVQIVTPSEEYSAFEIDQLTIFPLTSKARSANNIGVLHKTQWIVSETQKVGIPLHPPPPPPFFFFLSNAYVTLRIVQVFCLVQCSVQSYHDKNILFYFVDGNEGLEQSQVRNHSELSRLSRYQYRIKMFKSYH